MGSHRSRICKVVFCLTILQCFCSFSGQNVMPPNDSSLTDNSCNEDNNQLSKEEYCKVCNKSSGSKAACDLINKNKGNSVEFTSNVLSENVKNYTSDEIKTSVPFNILEVFNQFPSSFIPDKRASKQCVQDSKLFVASLKKMELWAMKMFDATAKLPSGILSGNINQYGDFDECVRISAPIHGKYCLASLDVPVKKLVSDEIDKQIHAHYTLSSNLTDLGHRVPRLSGIQWGVCIPASCSPEDLKIVMESSLQALNPVVVIEEDMCVSYEQKPPISTGKIITLIFFAVLLGLIAVGTIFGDSHDTPIIENPGYLQRIVTGFSLKYNYEKFMDISMDEEVPGCDGIRAINVMALLLTHKSFAQFYNPFINKTSMAEKMTEEWSVLGRTAIIYTDTFLLISAFLTSRSLFKALGQSGSMKFTQKLITRWFRIVPLLLSIILFYTYILPDLGDGPLWPVVINAHSTLCKANMWKNFMFIHNYMGFEKMCLTHTHQLGIDMQLFLATPLAVLLLWYKGKTGVIILTGVSILSSLLRFWTAFSKDLSMVIYIGMPVQKFFDSANFSYILPTHRASIYLIGVGLAYFMTKKSSRYTLSQGQRYFCLTASFTVGLIALLGPYHMGVRGYVYSNTEAAVYSALSPYFWGFHNAFIIWVIANESAGFVGDVLTWSGFRYITKIAYGVYLTQFPIFFYNIGATKYSGYHSISTLLNMSEFGAVILVSLAVTLAIEMPFSNFCKVITGADKGKKKIKAEGETENSSIKADSLYIEGNQEEKKHI